MSIVEKIPVIRKYFSKEEPDSRTYRGLESVRRRASVIFYIIRAFFRAIIKTHHHEVKTIGLHNVPPDGSVFLVGNHPNSFLDFFNLATIIRHPVATAAKDTITNTPILGPILKNHALMVPVSRAQDKDESHISEEERIKINEEMINNAVENLVTGRLFNIYGEGRSTDSRKLNKIKMGFMMLAIQAEKQFNFRLNLRIVPYGYYYDRINKFQNSVCIIFAKPFKLNDLIDIPKDYLSLSEAGQVKIDKQLMLAGKKRVQEDIERMIISIADPGLVDVIDDITSMYVLSPVKYMGPYENIFEKYMLNKTLSESIQAAAREPGGLALLEKLKALLAEYREKLKESKMPDAIIRREYTISSIAYQARSLFFSILYSPLILYGYVANFIPRQLGRFMRYRTIEVQKQMKTAGDEQALIAGLAGVLLTYPVIGFLFYKLFNMYCIDFIGGFIARFMNQSIVQPVFDLRVLISVFAAMAGIVLTVRCWRFSLFHSRRLRDGLYFLKDWITEIFRKKRIKELREMRCKIIDHMDFIIGDYY